MAHGDNRHLEGEIAMLLVILVVFAFLRSWRTTLAPAITVPVSLVATFGALYLFGYTVDNLSLMALTIATGFLVDDAIVMIENITRHLEMGLPPMTAALRGVTEIGPTVISISLSLNAVFIPILLMGGIVGRFFVNSRLRVGLRSRGECRSSAGALAHRPPIAIKGPMRAPVAWSNPPRLIGDLNTPAGDNSQVFSPTTGFPAMNVPMGYSRGGMLPVA